MLYNECMNECMGLQNILGRCWLLISDSVSSSYPILIRWRLLVCEGCKEITEEKKKGGKRRYLFNFNFISSGIFARLFCSEECLPELFENRHFSQIRR